MGRFYKTARPTFVDDAMYQAPYEMMMNALQTQDAEFKSNQEKLDGYSTMGDLLDYTDKDSEKRNEILNQYRGEGDRIAELMNENPALYEAYIGDLNRSKKAFEQDIRSGSLFEMDRTAKRRNKVFGELKADLDKGRISADAYEAARESMDNSYQGQGVNQFGENIHIYDQIDEAAFQKELKNTINIDTEGTTTTKPKGNGYMIQSGEAKSYLTKERLEQIIESDPTVDKWKREQLQTLTRQMENGRFESQEAMESEYKTRLDKFKENTIEKLNFKKIETSENISTDNAYFQRDAKVRAWADFNQKKKEADKAGIAYQAELSGIYEELPDSQVNGLYGDAQVRVEGPMKDGKYPTKEMSTAEKRARLNIEKNFLTIALNKAGIDMDSFKIKMKTNAGRIEMADLTGMSLAEVARQANYDKSYSFKPVVSPVDEGEDYKENTKFLHTVTNKFNNLPLEEMVSYKIVNSRGEVEEAKDKVSLGSLYQDNRRLVSGQSIAKDVKDLAPSVSPSYGAGFMGLDNEFITMPDPSGKTETNGEPVKVAATKEYVLSRGIGKSITTKENVFDATKPLLSIVPDQISQSEQVYYGNGTTSAKEKKVYNIHMSKMIDGELKTIIISKDLNITTIKNNK
jgi:hypothetical protein